MRIPTTTPVPSPYNHPLGRFIIQSRSKLEKLEPWDVQCGEGALVNWLTYGDVNLSVKLSRQGFVLAQALQRRVREEDAFAQEKFDTAVVVTNGKAHVTFINDHENMLPAIASATQAVMLGLNPNCKNIRSQIAKMFKDHGMIVVSNLDELPLGAKFIGYEINLLDFYKRPGELDLTFDFDNFIARYLPKEHGKRYYAHIGVAKALIFSEIVNQK